MACHRSADAEYSGGGRQTEEVGSRGLACEEGERVCPRGKIEMQTEERGTRRKRNTGSGRERKAGGEPGLTSEKGRRNKGEEESFN